MPATTSKLRDAVVAMLAAIRAINGTGTYNYSFAQDAAKQVRVFLPDPLNVEFLPCAFLASTRVLSGIDGVPLGKGSRTALLTWHVYAGGTMSDPHVIGDHDDDLYAVYNATQDIDVALMANRTMGGAVLDVYQSELELGLRRIGEWVYGRAELTYTVVWQSPTTGGL